MYNDFSKHYFAEENVDEANILTKSRFGSNLFRQLIGSAKRKIKPNDYDDTVEISPRGFANLFGMMTNEYNAKGKDKRKFFIKDLFKGTFREKDAHPAFADIYDHDKTVSVSFYKLNNGGNIILYNLKDDEGDDIYYASIDGKGEKFFAADRKKGGLGMVFKAWLAAQKTQDVFNLPDVPKGEKRAAADKLNKIEISKDDFLKLAPEPKKMKKTGGTFDMFMQAKLAAGYEEDMSIIDIFNEEVMDERKRRVGPKGPRQVFKDEQGVWRRLHGKQEISSPKGTDVVVDTSGDPDPDAQKDYDEWIRKEKAAPDKQEPEKTDPEEFLEPDEPVKEPEKKEEPAKIEKPEDIKKKPEFKDAYGELAFELKTSNELKEVPNQLKPTDKVKAGWRYVLKNNGAIFVYQGKDNKYYIGFDTKAKPTADKLGLVNKYGVAQATP